MTDDDAATPKRSGKENMSSSKQKSPTNKTKEIRSKNVSGVVINAPSPEVRKQEKRVERNTDTPKRNRSKTANNDLDASDNSSSENDYFGTFQRYLNGEKSAAVTRQRISERGSPMASPVSSNGGHANGTNEETNGSTQHTNGNGNANPTPKKIQSPPPTWWVVLRSFIIDIPLATLFALFLLAWFLRNLHTTYYQPLIRNSQRTDGDLLEEHTYYERQCNQFDLTTDDMADLMISPEHTVEEGVDIMMSHGLGVVPDVLSPSTLTDLRNYIVYRNAAVPPEEEYPMSQGEQRISYGIEATEDPAVARALQEVATHPVFRPLISALLGDEDPASSEITAITNFPGCSLQSWHQDTKQDGNALKFARTFSHSYSLFLPLQNITSKMGATDLCPGTHYCANDLTHMCENNGLGIDAVNPVHGFPAGSGALLNQHVWHRGGAHTDYTAPERIVFIVSFLARPKFDRDPRQLSRGTYFHQKWNMWGHTINDMLDPLKRMRPPFSIVRCLSLWKPQKANWGYDLITSGFMRIANDQLEFEEFQERFLPRLDQLHFPRFLWGDIRNEENQLLVWAYFINGTLNKCFDFFGYLALGTHVLYFVSLLVRAYLNRQSALAADTKQDRPVLRSVFRLCFTHGLLLLSGLTAWYSIRMSSWGTNIRSGRALMRPFPSVSEMRLLESPAVSKGPTTMPTRWDVLIGTRFDTGFIGAYDKWLDFHPGNLEFQEMVDEYASSYSFYKAASSNFRTSVIKWIIREIQSYDGRFLLQDFRTGEWRILNDSETAEVVSNAMLVSRVESLGKLIHTLDRMVAEARFGYGRRSHLSMYTHLLLSSLRKSLLAQDTVVSPRKAEKKTSGWSPPLWTMPKLPSKNVAVDPFHVRHSHLGRETGPNDGFHVGALVWWITPETKAWLPGTIMALSPCGDWFRVSSNDHGLDVSVHRADLRKFETTTEGDRLVGCFERGFVECFNGVVDRVYPGGELAIAFQDGDYEEVVAAPFYYKAPFVYEGPYSGG